MSIINHESWKIWICINTHKSIIASVIFKFISTWKSWKVGGGEEIFIRIVTRMEDRRLWMHLTLEIRCSGEQPAAFRFTATIRGLLLPGIFFLSTRAFCHGYLERAKLRDFDRQVYLEFIGAWIMQGENSRT